ncbi:hypothetical protein EHM69_12420, partial [candidate division KSB1 bacterium]
MGTIPKLGFEKNAADTSKDPMNKAISQKTKGKLTKKELKQDKLVELAYKMEHLYYKYQKWVLSAAGAILVIVVAAFLINRTMKSNRIEQSYQLTMAKMQYSAEQLDAAKEAFRRLVTSGSGTMAGEAKYFLGRIAFEQSNFSQAADEFSGYVKDFSGTPELDCAAMAGLAASYEAMGKPEDAAKAYLKIAEDYPKD